MKNSELVGKRVLVCGGRRYDDRAMVDFYLDRLQPTSVICGGARGADTLACEWARANNVEYIVYMADWQQHGRSAGPIRNKQMLDEESPDIVLAFPGLRGTANMVFQARNAHIPIIDVEDDTVEAHTVTPFDERGSERRPLWWRNTG